MLLKIEADQSDVCVCGTRVENEDGVLIRTSTNSFSTFTTNTPYRCSINHFPVVTPKDVHHLHLSDSWDKLYRTSFLKEKRMAFFMKKGLNRTDTLFNQILFLYSPLYSSIKDEEYIHVIYSKSATHRKNRDLLSSFQIIISKLIEVSKDLGLYDSQVHYIKNYMPYIY